MINRKDGGAANVPTLMPDYLTLKHHSGTFYTSLESDVSPIGKPNGGERYIKKKTAKLEAHILLDALFSVASGKCPDAEICEVIEEIADDYEYPPSDWPVIYNCASLRQHQQDGGWLPIESAPKDGEILALIQGCDGKKFRRVVLSYDDFQEEWRFDGSAISNAWNIVGYQPLPPAPKKEKDND